MSHWFEFMLFVVVGIPVSCGSGIIGLLIWTHHRRKMEELRNKGGRIIAEDIRTEFATIRAEIRDLRDTSMQYDLSFDTALQQMEHRMGKLERDRYASSETNTQVGVRL